jgi:hypothetical protein
MLEDGMRARLATLLVIGLLAVAAPTALAADPPTAAFGGPLTGAQENPPVATAATGEATVVLSPDDSVIWYVVTYSGLSGPAVAAHIHTGAVGVNGGIILPLTVAASPMTGTLTAANFTASGAITTYAQAVAAIKAGATYVNVHTAANPGGEIRAQVVAKGNAHFATLTGAQEVPPVTTTATGQGWVVISTDNTTITYFISYQGLSGAVVASHIHLGNVGANGGVMLPFTASVSPMTGTLNATNFAPQGSVTTFAGALAAIAAGGTYMNVHTAANPGGEIRGQLALFVAAPAPTAAPTAAPVAPAPTANPTVPPTATDTAGGSPSGPLGWLVLLAIVAAVALVTLPNRRGVVRERTTGDARPDRR